MRRGAGVVYQGFLEDDDGRWSGYPDFLLRVDRPSAPGGWSYEVLDTKLARRAKGEALLQLLLYSDLLAQAQGIEPELMHLALGGTGSENPASFRVAEYAAYYRAVRRRFEAHAASPPDTYSEPVEHCGICEWQQSCAARRRADDHLSLVAGITRGQRGRLVEQEVTTMAALGALRLPVVPRLDGIGEAALARIREQARVQDQARREGRRIHELVTPVERDKGLAALPESSDGDVFFDLEGDAFAADGGLEYLFGVADRAGNYNSSWALDPASEKRAFERFIDNVMARWEQHPDFHIYHYGAYETTAVKRLMSRYATREDEVDRLLRGRVFVNLHRVVRQGLRASVESYSIKRLEAVLRLRSRGGPENGDAGAHSGRGAARFGRCGRYPGAASDRDRGLQPGRLPLDAAPRRVAGRVPVRSTGSHWTAGATAGAPGGGTGPGAGTGARDRSAVRGAHRRAAGRRRRDGRRTAGAAAAGAPAGVSPARGQVHVVGVLPPLRLHRGGARREPGHTRGADLRR